MEQAEVMPNNMQKKSKVADLTLNEEVLEAEESVQDTSEEQRAEVATMATDDARYLEALKYYQHGNSQKKIADRLVNSGMSRMQASHLAKRVMEENPNEERTNALIIVGASVFFAVIGLAFITGTLMQTGQFPLFAPSNIFFIIALWFAYKGWQAWRSL